MVKVIVYNGVRYDYENDVPVDAIREEIKAHFPGKGNMGVRKKIWETILRGGRAENLVYVIGFSFREVAQEKLRSIDATVNGTMDVCMEPPRRVR